jgi:hypothetical protein
MISDNRENRRRSSLTTESSPRKDVDMTQNELAERLRDMSDALNICGADYSDVLLDAARELDRRSWIPVTERLPNRGEWVLAYGPHYSHIVAECDRGEWRSVYRDSETGEPWLREAGMVTHWMPLPAPPSDDE